MYLLRRTDVKLFKLPFKKANKEGKHLLFKDNPIIVKRSNKKGSIHLIIEQLEIILNVENMNLIPMNYHFVKLFDSN